MRKVVVVGMCAWVGLLAAAAGAEAAIVNSADFTVKVARADRHKARGGLSLRTTLKISDDTGAKPAPLTHVTLRFPRGSVLNARFFPKCKKALLAAKGPEACPKRSKLGTGTARGDARPFVADVPAAVTMFNGKLTGGNPTLLIYAVPDLGPILTLDSVLKRQSSGPYGLVLDQDVPPIATLPGQPNASVTFFDVTTRDITVRRKGRTIHFTEGPIVCDGTYFLLDGAFSYEGGITNTVYERFTVRGGPRCP